jgi:hypothetical protein
VPLTAFQDEFEALIAVVDRVWSDPVLERFFSSSCRGTLPKRASA